MVIFRWLFRILAVLFLGLLIWSCSGNTPSNLGVSNSKMATCPSSPNCFSSDAQDKDHYVKPFQLAMSASQAWRGTKEVVSKLPRTRIVSEKADYLHAECRSALFGFVDDLELNLRPSEGIIAVRSASRLGYSDFGVNRKRIEALRTSLVRQGIIR